MATRSSIFPSVSGDRFYIAADFLQRPAQESFAGTGDGVSREVGGSLAVTETSPASLAVDVDLGVARVNGWRFEVFTGAETVTLDTADGTNDRIDRIVLRARTGSANRNVILDKLTGTPATTPTAPALTRSGDVYEISLAQVRVNASVTSVGDADITDERGDNSVAGWLRAQDSELLQGKTPDDLGLESGTRAFFQQTTAPLNWTKDTSAAMNNAAMRMTTGTAGTGSGDTFDTALRSTHGMTNAGAHNHGGTNSHTLTASQIPSHTHNIDTVRADQGAGTEPVTITSRPDQSVTSSQSTDPTGGGGSHSHGIGTDGDHSHTFNLNVKFVDSIVAVRD